MDAHFLSYQYGRESRNLLFTAYRCRSNVENDTKELKGSFGFDQTDSSTFVRNTAQALISGIAYRLIQLFEVCLIPENPRITIDTLRFHLFPYYRTRNASCRRSLSSFSLQLWHS
ncbi:transposase [Lacticaseibacillus parahuelsenbergensis]|uniref:Transposase n=1 Tax=Lacticaseibacillus parahuelsenbergensis TaxID=3068305 RepID=A0ABY9KZW8_9LACO|nr:transposase [Lacticaseibacillus sp. NCIMB 15471]WLV77066.1 transposase [Lacticaseibacillus sp. NCIMB 15471]